ncbi:hypothetical protein NW768_000999 [Fusarium equiseti]|uniref:Uncharacterized protein n=1 Tax=Fusarium equiseti TaxID=61235 RepID=A0ABQ8RUT0_FUSEQ|nr:hypothetical protein NW768_000999 [Fusarium equiseti]
MHRPTLESQGFDLTCMDDSLTDDVHQVWDRTHHVLIQNHIGYLVYSLGLEREYDGWQLLFSELAHAFKGDDDSTNQKIFRYLAKKTMPFKAFMRMRMESAMSVNFNNVNQQTPNVLWGKSPWLRQISRSAAANASIFVQPQQTDKRGRMVETHLVQRALLRNTEAYGNPFGLAGRLNPYPMILPPEFLSKLEEFHEALNLALVSIIDRWWSDEESDFPTQMPLDRQVEKVLRWVARGSKEGRIKPYKDNQGNLRPDILIPEMNGYEVPEFKLCEINARFPENYLLFTASSYQALASDDWNDPSIKPATDHNRLLDSFLQLFDPSKPIHLLKESLDVPSDTPLYGLVEKRTGFRPQCIKPSSLRLVPCSDSLTGFELYCQHDATSTAFSDLTTFNGEVLERVHQVGLQLFDFELLALEESTIQEIARRSVNDLRSVFIAHDKRIVGIIRQELDALAGMQIITRDQAQLLRDGIIPAILPGSADLQDIIERSIHDSTTKDNFIIKPFRLARGSGIM